MPWLADYNTVRRSRHGKRAFYRHARKYINAFGFLLMEVPGFKGEEGNLLIFADARLNPNPNSRPIGLTSQFRVPGGARICVRLGAADSVPLVLNKRSARTHPDVDKVVEAVQIAREREPDVLIDGELQADAAIVPGGCLGKKLMGQFRGSRANILIFLRP